MTRIGLEWQFQASGLSMADATGADPSTWTREFLPSKSLVYSRPKPGVHIESDSGEVEIITSVVGSWPELKAQLVLVGDLVTVLTGVTPNLARLGNRGVADELTPLLGRGFGGASGTGRTRRGVGVVTDNQVLAVDDSGNIGPPGPGQAGETIFRQLAGGGRSLVFAIPMPIYATVSVANNVEVRPLLLGAGSKIAIVRAGGTPHGVAQCTVDRDILDADDIVRPFFPGVDAMLQGWLPGGRRSVSGELYGFLALIAYYLHAFGQRSVATSAEGPKTGFNVLPRMNLRSVYRNLLDHVDRQDFAHIAVNLPAGELDAEVCPYGYKAGTDKIVNPLTLRRWLYTIMNGDAGSGVPTLDEDYAGTGPRGADYDALSPPLGYPAHTHPARTSEWFTYAMGRVNATPGGPVVFEYRDVTPFGVDAASISYENFVDMAVNAARANNVDDALPD